jgi:divalent metal cation (Fe/Co/Zn/Cd) transporter
MSAHAHSEDVHALEGGHGHSHGLISASIKRSKAGLRAVSLSLVVLLVTSAAQAVVFVLTDSVALLADLIHNFGDALSARATLWWPRSSSARASRCGSRSSV